MKEVSVKNNIIEFCPHSYLAASTTKVTSIDINIDDIITRYCWENRKTFFKFYEKNMVKFAPDDMDFNCLCQKELMQNNFGVNIMISLKYL